MNVVNTKSFRFLRSSKFILLAAIACSLSVAALQAQPVTTNYYFHVNGTSPGFGINANDNLSWDDMLWTTNSTGAPNITWAVGSLSTGPGFARFNSTTTPYTVTVNNTEINAGLFGASGVTVTINAAGSGNLNVVPSATLTGGLPVQGFFTGGGTVIINAPITGTGGVSESAGGGNLELLGTNTYSGGTVFNSSGTLTYFNNNNSFGTGPININGTTFAPILGTGGATITLANNWTNLANGGVNFAADANTPVILAGSLALQTFALNLRNNGVSSSPLTWSGPIRGSGSLNLTANSGGMITLSGANTYSGATTIGVGGNSGANVIVSVSSLSSVSGGSANSNLGHPTTVANGTIGMGSTAVSATLIYTGAGQTSDRVINLAGTTGAATLEADGTGALVLTANNTATGAGAKTLTLQGSNTAANSIGKIVDSGNGATAVVKAQAGSWKLTGANTYTGGTTVNAGTLEISGSVVGGVTNNGGALKLDSNSTLPSSASVSLSSAGSVNLNFSGAQPITTLVIDGVTEPANTTWGAPGSGAQNQNAIFTGAGILFVSGSPIITQQPQSQSVYPDGTATFNVVVIGDPSFTYQWKKDGNNILGANGPSLTISPAEAPDAGAYTIWITNNFGFTDSQPATLTILPTNSYVNTVRSDNPIAYWRLDETNGAVSYDWLGGYNGVYNNVILGQPGYSVTDPDPSIGLPASSPRGYMQVTNVTPFVINGGSVFTLECWAYFTNLTTKGRFFSTLSLSTPNGYAFGVLPGGTGLEFTSGFVADNDVSLTSPLTTGQWYHLVCACDGNNYNFYVNGAPVGSVTVNGHAPNGTANLLQLGANPPSYTIGSGDGGAEQVYGRIDEAAFYAYPLSQTQITNHFTARYGTLAPPIVFAPIVNPPTNYVSLSATLQADAAGTDLTYQWYKAPSTLLSGQTDATLTLSPLQLSDGGSYFVQVSNVLGTSNSPVSTLTVLPIPADASQLNVTNGLVLHLPFDSDFSDISGRGNNGTNVGATLIAGGAVGSNALHYETDITPGVTNYVTLGVRPDLKFSSNVDFTVSYWVRQPAASTYTNLPFFGDAVGSTGTNAGGNLGFVFAPYETADAAGGWQVAIAGSFGSMSTPSQFTSFPDSNLINDGNWHHLVHVATRAANVATYLDGVQVDSEAISFVGDTDNGNAAIIGQDPTGAYAVSAQADLDDLGVWRRTLTPLEVSGIYLAGATNHVSFAPAVTAVVRAALQIVQVSPGQYQIIWTGGGTLQASGDVTGTYTNVPSASSPYPVSTSSTPQLFYRLKY